MLNADKSTEKHKPKTSGIANWHRNVFCGIQLDLKNTENITVQKKLSVLKTQKKTAQRRAIVKTYVSLKTRTVINQTPIQLRQVFNVNF